MNENAGSRRAGGAVGRGDRFIHNRTTFSEWRGSGDPVLPYDVVDDDFDTIKIPRCQCKKRK